MSADMDGVSGAGPYARARHGDRWLHCRPEQKRWKKIRKATKLFVIIQTARQFSAKVNL